MATSAQGQSRRFRDVRDESGLPPGPERLRQRSEPTLRATRRKPYRLLNNSRAAWRCTEGAASLVNLVRALNAAQSSREKAAICITNDRGGLGCHLDDFNETPCRGRERGLPPI